MILHGDCLQKLKDLPDNSIDSIVTDAPYGLSFMGKRWDYDVPSIEIWKECLRVLKPGGHALIACGTRTQHRMALNIEDAGFEIRDVITWLYGSGFPKSLDISKAIDKAAGAEREVISERKKLQSYGANEIYGDGPDKGGIQQITAPSTDLAKQWQGWGTALKPACEFWTLCRKPLSESTVAKNVEKWGVGGINIDGCRIDGAPRTTHSNGNIQGTAPQPMDWGNKLDNSKVVVAGAQGRFPANLILDEVAGEMLDEQSGILRQCSSFGAHEVVNNFTFTVGEQPKQKAAKGFKANTYAGASRFFYCAKSSKSERGQDNGHPCVKPLKLMQYLITLITPHGGTCLDPFAGSGSTLVAAKKLGFKFIGIEREAEYIEIIKGRLNERHQVQAVQATMEFVESSPKI